MEVEKASGESWEKTVKQNLKKVEKGTRVILILDDKRHIFFFFF